MRQAVNQQIRINILRITMLLLLPVILFVRPWLPIGGFGHEMFESIGTLVLIAGVLGRFWSILYVGGVKNAEVMQDGPYSMTRNPLYVSSTIAAFGIGLMLGALTFGILLGGVVGMILYMTARREGAFLAQQFGPAYDAYADRVPFFFPKPSLFHSPRDIRVNTGSLRRNLFDAMVFLSFIPLVEVIDWFKLHYQVGNVVVW